MRPVILSVCYYVSMILAFLLGFFGLGPYFSPSANGQEVRRPTGRIIYSEPTQAKAAPDWATHGVVLQPPAHGERYTAGSPEARRFVAATVEGPATGKIHVTVIGNADERARVTNDIKTDPAFNGIRDGLWVQDYDPKDWPVNPDLGFRPGKPAIIVQAARGPNDPKGGRVIYRTDDYSIGPSGLAEAIRKGNPDYKPDLDPGPNKPVVPSLPKLSDFDTNDLIAVGLVALLIFLPKKAK